MDFDKLPYLKSISLKEKVNDDSKYPFSIPAIQQLDALTFDKHVTFLVGENGSGKSTLIEAIAVAMEFNAEGGTKNFNFATRESHSELHSVLRLNKSFTKPKDGFFLRAESYFNVASAVEDLGVGHNYSDASLHEQSHGESFMALVENRFWGNGLYILDEPEAALSPNRQMNLLARMKELSDKDSQFIIATHSPILLAYPNATIYELSESGMKQVAYKETQHYKLTKMFLDNPERMMNLIFSEDE